VIYIIVTFFLAVGAINSQNNLLFASLGLAIGGLLVSGVLSGASLMGLRIHREPLEVLRVGRKTTIRYRVRNLNRVLPAFGLTITEVSGGGRDEPNWPRFARGPRLFVPHIASRGEVDAAGVIEPRRRGLMTLGTVQAWTTFPFGLAKKSISIDCPESVVVHPVELPVRPGILRRLTVRAMSGVGAAVAPGMGDEFYGLREYADGDSPRWIAWRRSARTGQMVVRQNTTPTPRTLWLVLRLPGAGEAETERAIALTAALVRSCVREGAAVGLAVPSHGVALPPRSSGRGVQVILDRLAVLDAAEGVGDAVFPGAAIRGAANAVIHAGAVERGFGSSRTRHIGTEDMSEWLEPGERLSRAMALLDRAAMDPDPARKRRSLVRMLHAWRTGVGG